MKLFVLLIALLVLSGCNMPPPALPHRVSLEWDGTALTYNVYRAPPGGELVFWAVANETVYVDESVRGGESYEYAVTALGNGSESDFSNHLIATVPEDAVQ